MNNNEFVPADPSTIQNKLLVGYQGWFDYPRDGVSTSGWRHWFKRSSENEPLRLKTAIWPDTSGYGPQERCRAGTMDGSPCFAFSSNNPTTVRRHFEWMAKYGVDGAFLRATASPPSQIRPFRNEVLRHARKAAEDCGRVFAIMYDISEAGSFDDIKIDWKSFDPFLASQNYLKEGGKCVVALSGIDFIGPVKTPDFLRSVVRHIQSTSSGGAYLIAVPANQKALRGSAPMNEIFLDSRLFDAILPWTVGEYEDIEGADKWAKEVIAGDVNLTQGQGIGYIPAVFPGRSAHPSSDRGSSLGEIPRQGGEFFWRQICNVLGKGATTIFCATWDGYDDGTALMPMVTPSGRSPFVREGQPQLSAIVTPPDGQSAYGFVNRENQPSPSVDIWFGSLAANAQDHLPSDCHYMEICAMAAEKIHCIGQIHQPLSRKTLEELSMSRRHASSPHDDVPPDVYHEVPPPYHQVDSVLGLTLPGGFSCDPCDIPEASVKFPQPATPNGIWHTQKTHDPNWRGYSVGEHDGPPPSDQEGDIMRLSEGIRMGWGEEYGTGASTSLGSSSN